MKCLLITSIFPPINGGSAIVYDSICRYSPDNAVTVLTPWRHYYTGEIIENNVLTDQSAPYSIFRTELLRPLMVSPKTKLHSLFNYLFTQITPKITG